MLKPIYISPQFAFACFILVSGLVCQFTLCPTFLFYKTFLLSSISISTRACSIIGGHEFISLRSNHANDEFKLMPFLAAYMYAGHLFDDLMITITKRWRFDFGVAILRNVTIDGDLCMYDGYYDALYISSYGPMAMAMASRSRSDHRRRQVMHAQLRPRPFSGQETHTHTGRKDQGTRGPACTTTDQPPPFRSPLPAVLGPVLS